MNEHTADYESDAAENLDDGALAEISGGSPALLACDIVIWIGEILK